MKKFLLKIADSIGITAKIPRIRIDAFLSTHKNQGYTLDLGGGDKPYKQYFPRSISVDIKKTAGVDIVADAHDLKIFKDAEFDCVLCTEVLEHLHTPQKAIDEMHRVLKPGGKVILTTRFIFPLHNIPGDYFRFTQYGLKHLFRNFSSISVEEETGTIRALAVIFERLGFQTDTLGTKVLSALWLILSKITLHLSWLITAEYGDVTRKEQTKNILASGYYVVAEK